MRDDLPAEVKLRVFKVTTAFFIMILSPVVSFFVVSRWASPVDLVAATVVLSVGMVFLLAFLFVGLGKWVKFLLRRGWLKNIG